jgi:uncharacterized protein with PQ loop repeat
VVFVTFYVLGTMIPDEPSTRLEIWATFLGVSSAGLAAFQYAPQIVHTYRMKLVGALSIPMMLIQTPGAIFMVLSIALRWVVTKSNSYTRVTSDGGIQAGHQLDELDNLCGCRTHAGHAPRYVHNLEVATKQTAHR